MAGCDPDLVKNYKKIIDDGYAETFGHGLAMEVERSAEHAANVSAERVETARQAVTARGRDQT